MPTAERFVSVDRRDDGVAVVTLDRPKANALSAAVLDELADVMQGLADDLPGAVVVTGGPRLFAAGADIAEFGGPEEAAAVTGRFRRALDLLARLPRITIAAVNGYALGGGCELALACDLRIASTTAKIGQPEILLGIIPGGGGTARLARLVGPSRAKDLVLTGRQVGAEEAARIGLVDAVVEGDATDAAIERAAALASGPVQAHALAKRSIDEGLDLPLSEAVDLESELFVQVFRTHDSLVGVQSFLEQGPGHAQFEGR